MSSFGALAEGFSRTGTATVVGKPLIAAAGSEAVMGEEYANHEPAFYRVLTGKRVKTDTGKKYWTDAIDWAGSQPTASELYYTIKELGQVPMNRLGKVWLSAIFKKDYWGARSGSFTIELNQPNYRKWAVYLNDLEVESDIDRFLRKLLLCEAAGLCMQGSYGTFDTSNARGAVSAFPLADPANGYPYHIILWDYYPVVRVVQQGVEEWTYFDKYGGPKNDGSVTDDEWRTIVGPATYTGYMPDRISAYCQQVLRYWERIYTKVMQNTFLALDVTKTEDEATVRTVLQQLLRQMPGEKLRLNISEEVNVKFDDGNTIGSSYRFTDFNGTVPIQGTDGKVHNMTIKDALVYQCEMAFFYGAWQYTLQKMGSRLHQLSDATALITASLPGIPWQLDPFENPFLVPDITATTSDNIATYRNIAASTARQTTTIVTSKFVRPQDVIAAPDVVQSLTRSIMLPSGLQVSPGDGGGTKKSALPWIAALAAAGIGAYAMLR
jgi:hypothetical protein